MIRKFALIKIAKGDYILPSNDGRTLWRIYQYEEDGMASWVGEGGVEVPIKGMFWATAKYDRPFHNQGEWQEPDFLEWHNWLTWDAVLPTRKAAIEAVLR